MSVLVTGGAGYIGSHTIRALRAVGHDVVVLDTLEYGAREAVLDAPLVVGDIADRELVREVCRTHGVTGVVHFAAYKNVGESMRHPEAYFRNNVAGTAALVEAVAAEGVRAVVFSSSCSVYGTPDATPVAEDAAIRPESVYAETKAMSERVLKWMETTHGVRWASLRYFNAAGASADNVIGEDWSASLNLVPLVMKAALGRRPPVQVFGDDYPTPDGTCIRDYIHVDDLAEVHVRALGHLFEGGASVALNVGTGQGSSVFDVIRATERLGGVTVPYEVVGRRQGDPVAVFADPGKVRDVLGWTPVHGLDEIVGSAWRWHSTHLDGYPSRQVDGG
ncbi:MAG TPA: UDP-glucose 4-epimerase GalE [Ilumatobacteraceae bacterium]|nr:UDP-glucose 4-epimerase GalE [Ilumatobacteraceae bacterium]